ncbi:MAG: TonB-dependent receptor, partial [Vicinamibacteria bacterium]
MNRLRGLLAVLLLSVASLVSAQPAQNGTLTGTVKDGQGGLLPGVSVTATSQERGFTREAVTDAQGRYRFPSIPIGSYKISAKLSGFGGVTLSDNLVQTENTTNVSFTMKVGGLTEAVEVVGEAPIVDMTNVSANTRVRREEFDKVPVGRSYQALMGSIPGVVGTGNVNSSGALTSNNLFLMDGIDTTDPTTGTFGGNLNFEAIEEVSAYTSAVSAEYGRAIGAVVNVITKSGTNKFEGSARYIATNDNWDRQNKTKSETTGASLERVKFDKVNPVWNATFGGPIKKNRAWFFGTYEKQKNTTAQRQTVGPIPENYQQTTAAAFVNGRVTAQITPKNMVWVKYFQSPTDGFVIDYWGAAAERSALTSQNQTSKNWAGQWSSVLSSSLSLEASFGTYASRIDVIPFEAGRHSANAPHQNLADGKYYNGATFDGYVERPRKQANIAVTNFRTLGGRSHSFKAGLDFQRIESRSEFKYPNNQLFIDDSYNQATGAFGPNSRRDFEAGPSISKGNIGAFYLRDKFEVGKRIFLEAGIRLEKQKGESDIGASTVNSSIVSPRLSGSFDVSGDGKTLIQASAGRFYTGILQSFSDSFAAVPQQSNYKNYLWNGSAYVFSNEVRVGASSFKPNLNLKNPRTDELTLGFQRQFGRSMGAGVR